VNNRRLYNIYQAFHIECSDYPVFCNNSDAWLGKGYYFWDVREDDAKWWGDVSLAGQYSICKSTYDYDSHELFDLLGNNTHVDEFINHSEIYIKRIEKTGKKTTIYVYQVIAFMQKNYPGFKFKAIRACPHPVANKRNNLEYFFDKKKGYLFVSQKTQLCVLDLNFLQSECEIIYTNLIDPNSCI
jgi:hypothetical protein